MAAQERVLGRAGARPGYISQGGAQFQSTDGETQRPALAAGDHITYEIKTSRGDTKITGDVAWIDNAFSLTWGISMTKVPKDKSDPFWGVVEWF